MAARKKPAPKKAKPKPRAAAKKPAAKKPAAKSRLTIPAQLARIESAVKRTLEVVEFLEGEIIKARDANEQKIEATPYDENT
jgi:hypothetical protein